MSIKNTLAVNYILNNSCNFKSLQRHKNKKQKKVEINTKIIDYKSPLKSFKSLWKNQKSFKIQRKKNKLSNKRISKKKNIFLQKKSFVFTTTNNNDFKFSFIKAIKTEKRNNLKTLLANLNKSKSKGLITTFSKKLYRIAKHLKKRNTYKIVSHNNVGIVQKKILSHILKRFKLKYMNSLKEQSYLIYLLSLHSHNRFIKNKITFAKKLKNSLIKKKYIRQIKVKPLTLRYKTKLIYEKFKKRIKKKIRQKTDKSASSIKFSTETISRKFKKTK